jgi:hypothetical protein
VTESSTKDALTIALIGGAMTVDDGTTLDSRQAIEGDPGSNVTRRALATSTLWWNTVVSLVEPVLRSAESDSVALVVGPKSLADLRIDGSVQRTSLRRFLPGGAGRVSVARTSMLDDELPDGFEHAATIPGIDRRWGQIGVRRERADRRWQLLNGNDYYLTHIAQHLGVCVLVDTSGSYVNGEEYGPPSAEALESFEQSRVHRPSGLVVLPHTHATETFVGRYVSWLESGRKRSKPIGRGPGWDPGAIPRWDPTAPPDPISFTHPIPIQARFNVTALVQHGHWVDPSALESARSLLQARYDLNIGIWDLVANPTLRTTLLEEVVVDTAPDTPANVPVGAAERARASVEAKVRRDAESSARVRHVAAGLASLQSDNWSRLERGWAECPLSEAHARWAGQEPRALVSLGLTVTKRATRVSVRTSVYNDLDLRHYVEERRADLEEIAGGGLPRFKPSDPVLLELSGGWGDEVDWPERAQDLLARTAAWRLIFAPLVDEARAVVLLGKQRAEAATQLRYAAGDLSMGLQFSGWSILKEGQAHRPLIQRPGEVEPRLSLGLRLDERRMTVTLHSPLAEDIDLPGFVAQHRKELELIAGSADVMDLDCDEPLLWSPAGGFLDEVDWVERGRELKSKTRQWTIVFNPLRRRCTQVLSQRRRREQRTS